MGVQAQTDYPCTEQLCFAQSDTNESTIPLTAALVAGLARWSRPTPPSCAALAWRYGAAGSTSRRCQCLASC